MKATRTFRWLIPLVVIATVVLAACGGAAVKPTAVPEQPTAAVAQPTEASAPTEAPAPTASTEEISLTIWDFGGSEFAWVDNYLIPEYKKIAPNVTIVHVGVPEEELGTKVDTAIAAGEPPDLLVFPSSRLAKAGHLLILDSYMARDGLSKDDFCPLFESNDMAEGKVKSLPIDTNVMLTVMNKDLFEQAGLTVPGPYDYITYDDWLKFARAINKPADSIEDRVWGGVFLWPPYNAMFHYQSQPYVMGDDGRTCVGTADADQWIHVWEILLTAWKEDLTTETAGAMLEGVEEDMFVQGKVGMAWGALGDAVYAREQGINVAITGSPLVTPGWVNNVGGWNTDYGILSACKHPEEAWQLLKWMSTEAPKGMPIGSDAFASGGQGGLPGLPAYKPLWQHERFLKMRQDEPFIEIGFKLLERQRSAPWTPNLWTSTDPFFEAMRRMTEDGVDVRTAIKDAAQQCQEITDGLWEEYDSLGQ